MEKETGPARLDVYVETLRARMPPHQFILLMRAFHAWLTGAGISRPHLQPSEQELFTPELQGELVTLMSLVDAPARVGGDVLGGDLGGERVVDGEVLGATRALVPAEEPPTRRGAA